MSIPTPAGARRVGPSFWLPLPAVRRATCNALPRQALGALIELRLRLGSPASKLSAAAGVILFGGSAVDRFCNTFGYEYIFRAHQEKSDGLKISKNARVVTVFSTSGYVGHQNGAGCVYVADGKIRLIIKEHEVASPDDEDNAIGAGKNKQQQQQQGRPSRLADN